MHVSRKHKRQAGVALFVSLILLIVITLVAASAMGISKLQLLIAGNTQYSMQAFQRGQSALETRFSGGGFDTTMSNDTADYKKGAETVATTAVSYMGSSNVPAGGYSLDAGYAAFHFEITADAEAPRGAESEQTQGFYIIGPGGN